MQNNEQNVQPGAGAPVAESAPEQQPTKTLAEQLAEAHALLEQERLKNIALRQQSEADQSTFRIELAKAQARGNGEVAPSSGAQARTREMAVRAVGGPAFWGKLSLDQKLGAMQERPASPEEVQLAQRLFSGRASREANAYAAQNPAHYARLRLIAQELR